MMVSLNLPGSTQYSATIREERYGSVSQVELRKLGSELGGAYLFIYSLPFSERLKG